MSYGAKMSSPPQGEGETSQAASAERSPRKQPSHLAWGLHAAFPPCTIPCCTLGMEGWWALRPAQCLWICLRTEPLAGGCSAVVCQLHCPAWKGLHCKHICSLVMHPMGGEGRLTGDMCPHPIQNTGLPPLSPCCPALCRTRAGSPLSRSTEGCTLSSQCCISGGG